MKLPAEGFLTGIIVKKEYSTALKTQARRMKKQLAAINVEALAAALDAIDDDTRQLRVADVRKLCTDPVGHAQEAAMAVTSTTSKKKTKKKTSKKKTKRNVAPKEPRKKIMPKGDKAPVPPEDALAKARVFQLLITRAEAHKAELNAKKNDVFRALEQGAKSRKTADQELGHIAVEVRKLNAGLKGLRSSMEDLLIASAQGELFTVDDFTVTDPVSGKKATDAFMAKVLEEVVEQRETEQAGGDDDDGQGTFGAD